MKIHVVGWYGENNLGDEHFRQVFENYLPYEATFSKQPEKSDLLIYGGGGVVAENYLNGLKEIDCTKIGVGVDMDIHGNDWKRICDSNFSKIWLRSKIYVDTINNRPPVVGQPEIGFIPDLAFYDYPSIVHRSTQKKIGVIVTHEMKRDFNKIENLARVLRQFKEKGYKVEFLSYYRGKGPWDDIAAHATGIFTKFKPSESECFYTENPLEMVAKLSEYELVFAMRYHGVIHCTMAHTPFVSLSYPGKHSLFCEQDGIPELSLHYGELTYDSLRNAVENALSGGYKYKLEMISRSNYDHVIKVFSEISQRYLHVAQQSLDDSQFT